MSYDMVRGQRLQRWCCDGVDCHVNYEVEHETPFLKAWAEVKDDGWVTVCHYVKGISKWEHYCPACKKELGE